MLIHGLPSPGSGLHSLASALSAERRVFVPDLPGYGPSAPLPAPYTFEAAQNALEAVLTRDGVREIDVIGFSGGAYRAFHWALRPRELCVRRIVSIGGLAGLDPDVAAGYASLADVLDSDAHLAPLEELMEQRMLSPSFAAANPDAVREVRSWLHAAPRHVIAAELRAMSRAIDFRPELRSLAGPVLARVGALDGAAPVAWSQAIAENAPHASLQVVAGCGHSLLIEDEAATIAAVTEFLDRK